MIKIKRLFILTVATLLLTFAANSFAEKPIITYYEYANKARYYFHLGKYEEATTLLDTAFNTPSITPHYIDYYCMALVYARLNEKGKALNFLERCIKAQVRGGIFDVTFNSDDSTYEITTPEFSFIKKTPELRSEVSLLLRPLYSLKFCNGAILAIGDSVDCFHANDMYWFSEHNRTNLFKSISLPKYLDTVRFKNHEDVEIGVVNFLKNNGYPGLRNGGIENMLSPLAHLSKERKREVLPILEKAWEEGNMTPSDYGFFLERMKMDDEGTACGDYYVIHTACDAAEWPRIRANRHSIGLSDYLDWGDYFLNTFDKPRSELPWVKKQLK